MRVRSRRAQWSSAPGALQVAAGFLLIFLGHLSFFLFHDPGAGRTPWGDVMALVGIVLWS